LPEKDINVSSFVATGSDGFADAYVREHGFEARRELGQHFLRADSTADRLVDLVTQWQPTEILEVGAGLGTLSRAILRRGYRLWAIEMDDRTAPVLHECRTDHVDQMRVTIADVGEVEIERSLRVGAALLSILPFNHDLCSRILADVFDDARHLLRGIVVVPESVIDTIDGHMGLHCAVIGRIEADEFVPAAPMTLCIASIRRTGSGQ
jgi:16S rRNA (adenine1518-N6/adenine1519-N6)-dimethyltransferase